MPTTFQSLMNEIFRNFSRDCVLVPFDDILVYGPSLETHLGLVLQRPRDHKLYANRKKCIFVQPHVKYLGHVISAKSVVADPS